MCVILTLFAFCHQGSYLAKSSPANFHPAVCTLLRSSKDRAARQTQMLFYLNRQQPDEAI